jgi:hypothetical protein
MCLDVRHHMPLLPGVDLCLWSLRRAGGLKPTLRGSPRSGMACEDEAARDARHLPGAALT